MFDDLARDIHLLLKADSIIGKFWINDAVRQFGFCALAGVIAVLGLATTDVAGFYVLQTWVAPANQTLDQCNINAPRGPAAAAADHPDVVGVYRKECLQALDPLGEEFLLHSARAAVIVFKRNVMEEGFPHRKGTEHSLQCLNDCSFLPADGGWRRLATTAI